MTVGHFFLLGDLQQKILDQVWIKIKVIKNLPLKIKITEVEVLFSRKRRSVKRKKNGPGTWAVVGCLDLDLPWDLGAPWSGWR